MQGGGTAVLHAQQHMQLSEDRGFAERTRAGVDGPC